MLYFTPVSDMFETDDLLFVQMELAGVKKEDINIELIHGSLEISGIKRHDCLSGDESFQRMERPFGVFKRTFDLPSYVDKDTLKASFDDGVLEIVIGKTENVCIARSVIISIK